MKYFFGALLVLAAMSMGSSAFASPAFASKIVPIPDSIPVVRSKPMTIRLAHTQNSPDLTDVKSFLTEDVETFPRVIKQGVFDCVGSIYLGISFSKNNHDLRNSAMQVRWFNPDGDLEMVSKHPDYASFSTEAFRWVGITLHRPQGGGLFSLLDHSAGMERFIGKWNAELWIAGEQFKALSFEVQC